VIREFVSEIERAIDSSRIVLTSTTQKYLDPAEESVYLKGRVTIIDASILEFAIFAISLDKTISIDKYRFHYMSNSGQMLFRYDNAPHHPELDSHPHHKHVDDRITPSQMPSLKDVLNEISAILLVQKITS